MERLERYMFVLLSICFFVFYFTILLFSISYRKAFYLDTIYLKDRSQTHSFSTSFYLKTFIYLALNVCKISVRDRCSGTPNKFYWLIFEQVLLANFCANFFIMFLFFIIQLKIWKQSYSGWQVLCVHCFCWSSVVVVFGLVLSSQGKLCITMCMVMFMFWNNKKSWDKVF